MYRCRANTPSIIRPTRTSCDVQYETIPLRVVPTMEGSNFTFTTFALAFLPYISLLGMKNGASHHD